MEKMTKAFLIFCSIALLPIALSYGAKPASSLNMLYGIVVDTTNLSHIMRAVMGLYLGMILIWLLGAYNKSLTRPALISCAVFMLGLASGRLLSVILDGWPHWLLIFYAVSEVMIGVIALYLDGMLQSSQEEA